ncbi:MAG: T9SS type A sorting domain-containing protein [Sphingobacteriales bacterium JAD_PAG50586_3]|nr:MAG: T9SS type A sorting domain-containing protein [Sphingobacteriales bacterium JAD_PAG50586_3]
MVNPLPGYTNPSNISGTQVSNPYFTYCPLTIDTIYLKCAHENNTGTYNKIRVEIVTLDNNLKPTSTVLWSKTDSVNTTISPGGNWSGPNAVVKLKWPVGYTTSSGQKVGINIKYIGSKADTFAVVGGCINNGSGGANLQSQFSTSWVRIPPYITGITKNTSVGYGSPIGANGWFEAQNWAVTAYVSYDASTPVVITSQPANLVVCPNTAGTIAVTATGPGLAYQWQVNSGSGTFTNITNSSTYSGVATANLTIINGTPGYLYRCIITSSACTGIVSDVASYAITTNTALLTQPENTSVCPGQDAVFSVGATGPGLTYQWYVLFNSNNYLLSGSSDYSGQNTANLILHNVNTTMDGYKYSCLVTGTCGTVFSTEATLDVLTPSQITTQPINASSCPGSDASFTIVSNGAQQWQVNTGSGFVNIVNSGQYTGATTATLTVINPTIGYEAYQYRCIVNNGVCPQVISNNVTITIQTSTAITQQPVTTAFCDDDNGSFSIVASGTALTYQWQENAGSGFTNLTNGFPYFGVTTANLSINDFIPAYEGYQYRCIVTNGTCTPTTSSSATVNINPPAVISSGPTNHIVNIGGSATFEITTITPSVTYQWQGQINGGGYVNLSNSSNYSGVNTPTLLVSNINGLFDGYRYRCYITNGFCADTSNDGTLVICSVGVWDQPDNIAVSPGEQTGFSIDAPSGVDYQWQVNTGGGFQNITNNATYSGADENVLEINITTTQMNNYAYRCIISNNTCADTSDIAYLSIITSVKEDLYSIRIYPNPVKSNLHIILENVPQGKLAYCLTDITGRKLYTGITFANGNGYYCLDTGNLAQGTYLINLTLPNGQSKTLKFLKAE